MLGVHSLRRYRNVVRRRAPDSISVISRWTFGACLSQTHSVAHFHSYCTSQCWRLCVCTVLYGYIGRHFTSCSVWFLRMDSLWVRCQAPRCGGHINSNGYTWCLCHSPCTQGHVYHPPVCPVCREVATVVLTRPLHLLITQFQLLLWNRFNLLKLASHNSKSPSWANPKLPVCLGLVHRGLPVRFLSCLLTDRV